MRNRGRHNKNEGGTARKRTARQEKEDGTASGGLVRNEGQTVALGIVRCAWDASAAYVYKPCCSGV